jgi:hypothetical protein
MQFYWKIGMIIETVCRDMELALKLERDRKENLVP